MISYKVTLVSPQLNRKLLCQSSSWQRNNTLYWDLGETLMKGLFTIVWAGQQNQQRMLRPQAWKGKGRK